MRGLLKFVLVSTVALECQVPAIFLKYEIAPPLSRHKTTSVLSFMLDETCTVGGGGNDWSEVGVPQAVPSYLEILKFAVGEVSDTCAMIAPEFVGATENLVASAIWLILKEAKFESTDSEK